MRIFAKLRIRFLQFRLCYVRHGLEAASNSYRREWITPFEIRTEAGANQYNSLWHEMLSFGFRRWISISRRGSNVYDFLTEYWVGIPIFCRGRFLSLENLTRTGEGLNESSSQFPSDSLICPS